MVHRTTVFFSPDAEGGVRLEGKSGKEAKNLVDTREAYKKYAKELNNALESTLFLKLADNLNDHQFDIDKAEDRKSMSQMIEIKLGDVNLSESDKTLYKNALALIGDLNDLYDLENVEINVASKQTKKKLAVLSEQLADFNENGNVGTDFKNERKKRKYDKRETEQQGILKAEKNFMDAIYNISDMKEEDKTVIKIAMEGGALDPDDLEESLAVSYVNQTMGDKLAKLQKARNERWNNGAQGKNNRDQAENDYEDALEEGRVWARNIRRILEKNYRWDMQQPDEEIGAMNVSSSRNYITDVVSLAGMAKLEKRNYKLEKKKQRKTIDNRDEVLMTEREWKSTIDATIKIVGQEEFSHALHERLARMARARNLNDFPDWNNAEELTTLMEDPDTLAMFRDLLYEVLPHMTVVSLKNWLTVPMKRLPSEEKELSKEMAQMKASELIEEKYADQIDARSKDAVDAVAKNASPEMSPAEKQEIQRKLRQQIAYQVAGGVIGVSNTENTTIKTVDQHGNTVSVSERQTSSSVNVVGLGVGMTVDLGRAGDVVNRMSIGVGLSTGGIPGFVIDFGKDIQVGKETTVHVDMGIASVVPFVRLSMDHTLNARALETTLAPTPLWKGGVYVEATPVYVGAGIYVGSNLMAGIERQGKHVEQLITDVLGEIPANITAEELEARLLKSLPNPSQENRNYIRQLALHMIDGMQTFHMTAAEIAQSYASAWTNHALKESKGHADLSIEIGIGAVLSVPVIKFFIGLKIYGRSTMRTDMYDKHQKENNLQNLSGFNAFDNSDVHGKPAIEKLQYWLGDDYEVSSDATTTTITRKKGKMPLYDECDVYVKDPSVVIITGKSITFPKTMNIFAGRLINAYSTKEKIYLGYDKKTDADLIKRPVNKSIDGNPALYNSVEGKQYAETVTERVALNFGPEVPYRDQLIIENLVRDQQAKFLEATEPGNKQKEAYNKLFGEFVSLTRKTSDASTYDAIKTKIDDMNTKYLHLFEGAKKATFDKLWNTSTEYKRYITNVFLQSASFSARLAAIVEGKGYKGSKNVGELLEKRSGHIDAFKKSGVIIDAHAFDAIYKNAKNIDGKNGTYSEAPVANAVSLVGFYRKGLVPTTGLVGFGEVEVVAGSKYRQDATEETKVYNSFIDIFQKTSEFEAQKNRINEALTKVPGGVQLNDVQMKELIKNHALEVNGVKLELPATFEKVLNGPCANEAYMLAFGELTITYKKPEGDVSVGVEYTNNYLTVNTFSIGFGGMGGSESRQINETKHTTTPDNPNPNVNPNPTGTTTIENGTTGTVTGDGGNTTDHGDGGR